MNYVNTNESTESALDLRQFSINSTESFGQKAKHDFPEFKNRKQTGNKRLSAAELQLKRRQEFEIKFNDEVKKRKLVANITPLREEPPRNDAETPTVQTPPNIRNIESLFRLLQARISTNFGTVLPNPLNSGLTPNPINDVNATSTLDARDSLLSIPVSLSNIKQEPTDEANIAFNNSNIEKNIEESAYVQIGPHGTRVSKVDLASIDWTEASLATRKLMSFLFDRQTLGTHTLSGKLSPAFRDRQLKAQLDPLKVADIKHYVQQKINCNEREIRSAITMKCADTAKAIRRRRLKLETSL
ncbi:early boundary activity protein 2-like [Bactrocera tryoni]|uniref:early boundary activity protein 2-like n=1 Tax=Bactrocera tryoni TaxID=59916 RepID=UPI001A96D30B|nr:early boundary activity protein 2-like [Bactrocera tryoni]